MQIPLQEYFLVRKLLQPYLKEDFLSNPKTGVDKAVAVMLGWETRFLTQKGSVSPPVLPSYGAPPASSAAPSSSTSHPQLNYVV